MTPGPTRRSSPCSTTGRGFDESTENTVASCPLGGEKVLVRVNGAVSEVDLSQPNDLDPAVETMILTVLHNYGYLIG